MDNDKEKDEKSKEEQNNSISPKNNFFNMDNEYKEDSQTKIVLKTIGNHKNKIREYKF